MLQSIRDSLTGWVVWFIVGLIAIPFAFVGIESFRMGSRDPVLVEVGGVEITQAQFRAGYEQRYQQLQAMLGDNFRADLFNTPSFRASVLEDMTQETVMLQYAEKGGYRGTPAAVLEYLRSIPAFQRDGRFSAEAYREVLARQGLTPERFERQLLDGLALDQMRQAVLESAFVPDALVEQAYRLNAQQRSLSYLTVPVTRFAEAVNPSEEEIAAHYEATRAAYQAPERLKLQYVVLDRSTLEPGSDPEQDVLQALYDVEKARFSSPGERKARHILIAMDGDPEAAKAKAESLRAELSAGADFEALAAEHSADTGSREQGGDLGWIQRGQMVEAFEKALFALDAGTVSEPVETEFGYHLIRVDEIKGEEVRDLSDEGVRAELLALYHNREREQRFQDLQAQLEQLAFENPGSLEMVAETLSLPVAETDWFGREGGSGLAAEPSVLRAAFSPEVLQDDENSTPLALGDGRIAVIRKLAYEAPRQRELAEVVDAVRAALVRQRAEAAADQLAEELLTAAQAGRSLTELADEQGLSLRAAGPVSRDADNVPVPVLSRLFSLPRPVDETQPSVAKVALDNGDRVLLALSRVIEPEPGPETLEQEREALENLVAGREFDAFQRSLRSVIKVKTKNPIAVPEEGEAPAF
jgi:peptidyl-prolyl cis-trans isomerase D